MTAPKYQKIYERLLRNSLTDPKEDSTKLMWMLGLALTLPMILLGGPLAGYLVSVVLVQKMGMPGLVTPALILLGLAGSGIQAYRLIQKLNQSQKKKNS